MPYPVHNYGTDVLGRMGLQMFQSSMDWDEKQKELERRALTEAAKREQEANLSGAMKSVEGGALPQGAAFGIFKDPSVARGIERLNEQNRIMQTLKSIKEGADAARVGQEVKALETKQALELWEQWGKRKDAKFKLGADVTYENDQLQVIGKRLTEVTGVQYNPVKMDMSELKQTKEDIYTKLVSDAELAVNDAAAKKDVKEYSDRLSALGAIVTEASRTLGVKPDFFLSASEKIKQGNQELPKMLQDAVKPKEPKAPHYQDLGDKVGVFDNQGNMIKTVPKGKIPGEEKDTATYKDWVNYNKSLVSEGKKPVSYQQYYDNIAHKFDIGKMLFGGGGMSTPDVAQPVGKVVTVGTTKMYEEGGKRYPIAKDGTITKGGKKFKVQE